MNAPTTMTERYGAPSASRRRGVVVASGVVGLVALAWLAWAAWFQSTPDVQSSMRSFAVAGDHTVEAEFLVTTRSAEVVANCLVRAFGEDHTVVGERNLEVTGVEGRSAHSVTFRTERRATSVQLVGCTTADQARPR